MPTVAGAALLFAVGAATQRRSSRATFVVGAVLAIPVFIALAYYIHLFDGWRWFYEARSWRYTELTFCGVGVLGGAVYRWHSPEGWKEHLAIPLATLVIVAGPFLKPVLAPLDVDALSNRCESGICLQSSPSTCGPASAATILQHYGHNVTERDLASESYTYVGGTEAWYLARALRNRGFQTRFL